MTMLFSKAKTLGGAIALLAGMTGAMQVQAEDIMLRLSTHHPSTSPEIGLIIEPMKQRVESGTGGAVKIEVYPNAMLNGPKDAFKALVTDIADIAPTYPVYQARSFQLNHATSLPQAFPNVYAGMRINEELYQEFYKAEWDKMGVHPLFYAVTGTYDLLTTRPVERLSDLEGMKIRAAGGVMNDIVTKLGANPVSIPISEAYTAFQQGVIDGIILGVSNMVSYRLDEIGKYYVPLGLTRTAIPWSISPAAFGKLTPEQQEVLFDASREATINYADRYVAEDEKALATLAERGIRTVEFPKADHEQIAVLLEPLWQEFIAEHGAQAEAMVKALRKKVGAYGAMDRETFVRLQREQPVQGMMPPR